MLKEETRVRCENDRHLANAQHRIEVEEQEAAEAVAKLKMRLAKERKARALAEGLLKTELEHKGQLDSLLTAMKDAARLQAVQLDAGLARELRDLEGRQAPCAGMREDFAAARAVQAQDRQWLAQELSETRCMIADKLRQQQAGRPRSKRR